MTNLTGVIENIARGTDVAWRATRRQGTACAQSVRERLRRSARVIGICAMLGLLVGMIATPAARAQGTRKDDIVFNAQGRPMAGASVRVCTSAGAGQPCAPLANIYSDAAMTQALANPLATDGLGNYTFYAAPGRYMIEIDGPGIITKQLPNVVLPNDPSSPTFTSITSTSGISAFSLALSGNLTVSGSTAVTGTLTVGGAPVPSTGQANTWSAAQTFSQDVISGSFTPWTDIRANGGTCNGTASDTSAFTNTLTAITYPTGNGGTIFVPHNCNVTPGTLPWNQCVRNTIGLGGQLNLGATLGLAAGTSLKCMAPGQYSPTSVTSFGGDKTCQILAADASTFSPLVDLTYQSSVSNPFNLTDLTILTPNHPSATPQTVLHTQFGTLGHQIVNVNAVAQYAGDLACDFEGFYTTIIGGSCQSGGSETILPALRWNNSSGTNGGLFMDRMFVGNQGMLFTWKTPSTGTQSGSFTFRNMLQENVTAPFSTYNTYGGTTFGMLYENIAQADPASNASMVEIKADTSYCTGCSSYGNVGGFVMLNPQPTTTLFHSPAVTGVPDYQQWGPAGAFVVNLFPSKPLGIYGQWGYQKFDQNGAVFQTPNTNSSGRQPALVSGGVATGLPNPENVNCTGSSSGGTIPAGTYYLQAAHTGAKFDGTAEIGFLSGELYVTLTGSTSSIACSWTTQPGAQGTRVYMGATSQGESQYFAVSGSTASITITSATGTSGPPDTLNPSNAYIALNSYDNPYGASWFGMGGNVCIGLASLSCPSKLYVSGAIQSTVSVKSPLTQLTAGVFSTLSACASGLEGTQASVTDSTTNTWGATITGGGSNHVLAYCDGTNWTVIGK